MIFYTAMGDSITYGESASSPQRAYPALVASLLRSRSKQVHGLILAEPGWTSNSLLQAVLSDTSFPLQSSTTISIWIGGDDLLQAGLTALRNPSPDVFTRGLLIFRQNLDSLIRLIRRSSRAQIVLCTQYNPFPNTALAAEAISNLNEVIADVAARHTALLAPADSWFTGREAELIAGYRHGRLEDAAANLPFGPYPIHPNDKGHSVIAHNLAPYIR